MDAAACDYRYIGIFADVKTVVNEVFEASHRDDDWDVQSIASIDAEVTKTDNSKLMNELNRLVNR